MKELDPEARVWRVYNDESERIDGEMVEGWKSTLDTLFIFVRTQDHLYILTVYFFDRLAFSQPL